MDMLSYSLYFTLFIWIFYVFIGIYRSAKDSYWTVNANILLYTFGLPAIVILIEYLILR